MALTAAEEAQTRELLAQQASILALAAEEPAIISSLGATDVSLSDLTAASSLGDSDLLLVRQGVTDKSITGSIVKSSATAPDASETSKGIVELATAAETISGTDSVRAIHPAGFTSALAQKAAQILTAAVPTFASGAMTIPGVALNLDFRSTTLSSGTISRVYGTPANLVVPSGATLGTISGVSSDIVVLALNNSGTIEYAVVNLAGGVDLTETGLVSTTAISSGATATNVVYSTTARTSVAYRVVQVIRSTQTTAGTWAQSPTLIQGAGGQAMVSLSSLGYGQTWQNVTGSRALGTTYYNTTGRPIAIHFFGTIASANPQITINGMALLGNGGSSGTNCFVTAIIPPGASYTASISGGSLSNWFELR